MNAKTKKIIIGAVAVVAVIIVYNILPKDVRIASAISFGVGIVGGIVGKIWYDKDSKNENELEE